MHIDAEYASEALARLEAGPGALVTAAVEPRGDLEAVAMWLEARGFRRGRCGSPPTAVWREAFIAYAAARGWAAQYGVPGTMMGRHLRRLGYVKAVRDGRASRLVDAATAEALWALSPTPRPRPRKRQYRPHRQGRRTLPPFWPLHASSHPLVDSSGRVYANARVAGRIHRVPYQDVQDASKRGGYCAHRVWRRLLPEELSLVPPDTLSGQRVPALEWRAHRAVHFCHACDARLGPPPVNDSPRTRRGTRPRTTPPHSRTPPWVSPRPPAGAPFPGAPSLTLPPDSRCDND